MKELEKEWREQHLGQYYSAIVDALPDDWPFQDNLGVCRWIMPVVKLMHTAKVPPKHCFLWLWQQGGVIEHDVGDRVAELVRDQVQAERDRLRHMQPGWN